MGDPSNWGPGGGEETCHAFLECLAVKHGVLFSGIDLSIAKWIEAFAVQRGSKYHQREGACVDGEGP